MSQRQNSCLLLCPLISWALGMNKPPCTYLVLTAKKNHLMTNYLRHMIVYVFSCFFPKHSCHSFVLLTEIGSLVTQANLQLDT